MSATNLLAQALAQHPTRQYKVAAVIDSYHVVINAGRSDGVTVGTTYVIYAIGDEITDPDTGQSLGRVEMIKGRGTVTNVQEKIATLESSDYIEVRRQGPSGIFAAQQPIETTRQLKPFSYPEAGDFVRLVKLFG